MKLHKWADIRKSAKDPKRDLRVQLRAANEVLELNLAALRKGLGVTQARLAELANMSQGEVSQLERRVDMKMSSIGRYVKALGGKVEIMAVVGKKRVPLFGIDAIVETPPAVKKSRAVKRFPSAKRRAAPRTA